MAAGREADAIPGKRGWTPAVLVEVGLAAIRAFAELARARIWLCRMSPALIEDLNAEAIAGGISGDAASADQKRLIEQVSYIIPRIGHRVPWRGDCLVQAIAAQHWLLGKGIASVIVIGIDKSAEKGFEAHAWLRCGDKVLTGGEISRYRVLLDRSGEKS